MKNFKLSTTLATIVASLSLVLISCGGGGKPVPDLDLALDVASNSLTQFDASETDINEENAMAEFATVYTNNLNSSEPPVHTGPLAVVAQSDGSFTVFDDKNSNKLADDGEDELFKVEVDEENGRLIASAESYVRDRGFSGGGLLMGYLIGSMLGRQRAAGVTPSSKKASPKMSAKQRAGSGSHSRGK